MTQYYQVLQHLMQYEHITDLVALHNYGIRRLAARIHELRQVGYRIRTERLTVPTRYGTATVARYWLEDDDADQTMD